MVERISAQNELSMGPNGKLGPKCEIAAEIFVAGVTLALQVFTFLADVYQQAGEVWARRMACIPYRQQASIALLNAQTAKVFDP